MKYNMERVQGFGPSKSCLGASVLALNKSMNIVWGEMILNALRRNILNSSLLHNHLSAIAPNV